MIMMMKTISFVALLAICLASIQRTEASWFSSNKDTTLDYDAINRYLVENVEDNDPELNLDQAAKWLEKKRLKGKKRSIVKALENFVALRTIVSDEICNRDGLAILNAVDIGTHKKVLASGHKSIRRVDRVLRHYAKAHAERCLELYPDLLTSRKAQMGEGVANHVDKLKEHNRLVRFSRTEYTDADLSIVARRLTEFNAHNFLLHEFASDPDAKYLELTNVNGVRLANEAKLRDLFNRHIYEPCKEFYEKVGEDLSGALDFHIRLSYITGIDAAKRAKVIGDKIGLDICRRFVQNKEFREVNIDQLVGRIY